MQLLISAEHSHLFGYLLQRLKPGTKWFTIIGCHCSSADSSSCVRGSAALNIKLLQSSSPPPFNPSENGAQTHIHICIGQRQPSSQTLKLEMQEILQVKFSCLYRCLWWDAFGGRCNVCNRTLHSIFQKRYEGMKMVFRIVEATAIPDHFSFNLIYITLKRCHYCTVLSHTGCYSRG